MKRLSIARTLVLGVALLAFSASANAQINLGNIISGLTGGNSSSSSSSTSSSSSSSSSTSSTSSIISKLVSVFSGDKQATSSKIIGTWEYSEPAIVFSSDNLLSSAGASIASSKIEDKLQEQLSKFGFESGAFTITFEEDSTFTTSINSREIKGKWSVSDSQLNMTYGTYTVPVTTQLSGSELMFVTDATKLLDMFKTLGSNSSSSTLSSVTSLMSSIDGMQVGITLVKK